MQQKYKNAFQEVLKRVYLTFMYFKRKMRLLILLFFSMGVSAQGYKTQPYKVVAALDQAEIRYYPEAVMVKTTATVGNKSNFSKLFSYITKVNDSKTEIAMTTPVYRERINKEEQMAFVLPKKYLKQAPPQPLRSDVKIFTSAAGYFIALQFGGYVNAAKTVNYQKKLDAILEQHQIEKKGTLKILTYNSPFSFFNRRNEVLYEIAFESIPKEILPTSN